jgi:membrane dipeptidase
VATSEELELHVNELHDSTVVVNTYGGPYTSANVLRKFRMGHWRYDLDEFIEGTPPFVANVLAPEMKTGGVDVIVGGYARIEDHALWLRDLEESDGAGAFVANVDEMKQVKKQGQVGLQICLHGPHSIKESIELLRVHRQLGATVFTLCSSYRNEIVDGCREPDNAGLSLYGRRVVAELNRLKIAVDVSHISEQGLWDVLEYSTAPPITTHTAAKAICPSPRNFTDEQLKALADAGSYIGVIFFPSYLNAENPTVEDLLDHIDHIAKLIGPEYIGLGADFCQYGWEWTSMSWARSNMPERRYKFPDGIEDVTKWKNVTRGLIRRGYTDDEIRGILGGNYLRIIDGIIS